MNLPKPLNEKQKTGLSRGRNIRDQKMKHRIQLMETRSGGPRCTTPKGMATSFAGTVSEGIPAHLAARALAGFSEPRGCVWRAAGGTERFGSDLHPLKHNFAAQVSAKPADTEL